MSWSWPKKDTVRRAASLLAAAWLGVVADRVLMLLGREAPLPTPKAPEHVVVAPAEKGMNGCYELGYHQMACMANLVDWLGKQPKEANCEEYFGRIRELRSVWMSRRNFGEELVWRLGKDRPIDTRTAAAFLLGELQVAEAAEALLDHIDMEARRPCGSDEASDFNFSRYPAEYALESIGRPAVVPTLKRLAGPGETDLRREREERVIVSVEHGKTRALQRVEVALAMEEDPVRKLWLEKTLHGIDVHPDEW